MPWVQGDSSHKFCDLLAPASPQPVVSLLDNSPPFLLLLLSHHPERGLENCTCGFKGKQNALVFSPWVRGVMPPLPPPAAASQLASQECCLWWKKALTLNLRKCFPQNLGGFAALASTELDKQWNCISCLQDLERIRHFGVKAALQ